MDASAKSALAYGFCTFFTSAISFLVTPLFTRIMSTEQFGVVTDYNSWRYIIEVFAVLGLMSVGAFNVGLNEYRKCRDRYIANMLILSNIATVIVFAVIFAVKLLFYPDFILPKEFLQLMFIHFLLNPALSFWSARQRYEYKYKLNTVVTLGSVVLSQGLAVILVLTLGSETAETAGSSPAFWKQLGTIGGFLIIEIPIYVVLMVKGLKTRGKQSCSKSVKTETLETVETAETSDRTDRSKLELSGSCPSRVTMWKQMLIFTLPLIPHYLAMHVMNGADRIMVGRLISNEAEAVFGVVSTIGTIATMVWVAINASLMPYIFENMNVGRIQSIRKTTTILALCYGILCIMVCLVAPEALWILGPEEYQSGVYAIPPIAAMAFFNALYNIFASIEFYYKKSVGIAIATIVATLIDIGLNYWLIPQYGLVAAAYTTLIANAVLVVAHYIGYRRCCEKRIFDEKLLFALAIICTGVCLVCNFFYEYTLVRYGLIAGLLIAAVLGRKQLMGLWRNLKK